VGHHSEAFIGIDTSKSRNAVAIAEGGRGGEVRYLGELPTTEAATRKLVAKLAAKYSRLSFCYEAGPTGYGLYRLSTSLDHECLVAAPSLTPKKPSDHVKTNRRDTVSLARLTRAGELTAVWVPDGYRRCAQGARLRAKGLLGVSQCPTERFRIAKQRGAAIQADSQHPQECRHGPDRVVANVAFNDAEPDHRT
jgi:hypothetical protein